MLSFIVIWVSVIAYNSLSLFIALFKILIIQLSIFYLVIIMYTLFICTSTSPFLTHPLGRFLTTLDLHVQIGYALFHWPGVRGDHTLCEWSRASLFYLFWYSCPSLFLFCSFLDFCISDWVSISFLISYDIMCGHLYVILQWSWFIIVQICSLFRVT